MTDTLKLTAESRTRLGTSECRRLRRQGLIPGNVYGHGQTPEPIAVTGDAIHSAVRTGHRVVECEIAGKRTTAMIRDVQWDTYGLEIQHFDLQRVDADERVTVDVLVELKGTPPGVTAGGHLEQPMHELTVNCLAVQMPESIVVRVSHLNIGDAVHVSDLELPSGVTCEDPPEQVVVQVVAAVEVPEVEEEIGGPTEPEVIGEKKEDEEGEG